jgi:hypothetical protein
LRIGWIVLVSSVATCSAGYGQELLPDHELSRIPVGDRLHPDYEPVGYRLGPYFFYPKLSAGLRYDSNVFASGANPRSDWYALISPELTIRYGMLPSAYRQNPSRFSYEINLNADIYRFRDLTSEDRVDARGRLRTHWDIAEDLRLDTAFEAARRHDERGDSSSPRNASEPVPYTDIRGEATLTKTVGRFGVAFNGSARSLAYENVTSFDGSLLDQSGRDGTIYSTYIKPFYELAPGYRAFVRIAANKRNYEATGDQNRDSHGYDVRAGLDFAFTPLLLGSIEAGYLSQSYDNPLIAEVNGPSFKGELTWLATALLTIRLEAERRIAETITPQFDSRLDTSFGVRADYELLRNVVVFGGLAFRHEDFTGTARNDDVTKVSAGVNYLMNRALSTGVRYDFISRDSTMPVYSFDKHVVMFNVTAQY